MKIKSVQIDGVGGIESLQLTFNPQMNLICGPNGIGKTTVLEILAHIFSNGSTNILKRNVNSQSSYIKAEVEADGSIQHKELKFDTFVPEKETHLNGLNQYASWLMSLKTARTFQYQALQAVNKDSNKEIHVLWNEARNGINLTDIKNWFVNRYLYSAHRGALTNEQLHNFELAKSCFSLLNKDFVFSKVDASSNEIMINTPSGEIYYEYLSSGFKSIISILFGIIKEVEFRFKEPRINAVDFNGVILIDELELHLHPEWQEKIVKVLTSAFPHAQFFASTHSPHIVQTAEPNQIIALGQAEKKVIQRELPKSGYGFQGWSVEEVLTDVMGMQDTRTEIFNELISDFQKFIESNDSIQASATFEKLDSLLHPSNHLRKLLKFQLLGIKEDKE